MVERTRYLQGGERERGKGREGKEGPRLFFIFFLSFQSAFLGFEKELN